MAGRNILLELTSYDPSSWKDLFIKIPSKKVFHFLLDMNGHVLYADSTYYATIKQLKSSGLVMRIPFNSPGVFGLQNSGLAFTTQKRISAKNYNYSITFFINGAPQKNWKYHSDENYSDFNPYFIAGDSNYVYFTFSRIVPHSNKPDIYLKALETRTGKIIFEKVLAYKNIELIPLKAFQSGEKIEIVCKINSGRAGDYADGNIYIATFNSKGDLTKFDVLSAQVLNSIPGMPANGMTYIRTMVQKPDGTFVLIAEHSIEPNNNTGFLTSISHSMLYPGLTDPMFDGIIFINCNSSLDPGKISFLYWQPSTSFQFIREPVFKHFSPVVEMSFIYHEIRNRDSSITFIRLQYDSTISSAKTILKTQPNYKTTFYEGKPDNLLSSSYNNDTKMLHLTLVPPFQ